MLIKFTSSSSDRNPIYVNPINVSLLVYVKEDVTRIYMNAGIDDYADVLGSISKVANTINAKVMI